MHDKQVALVTGANQGIGLQIAKDLAAKGVTVMVGARDFAKGKEAAATIEGNARAIQIDVTDRASIKAAAERIRAELGRLDILMQNAAISHPARRPGMHADEVARLNQPSNVSFDDMRAVWETNVFGVLAVYQEMLPLLRATPGARIVNVSSGMGSLTSMSNPDYQYRHLFGPVYPASKTALNALTVAMAIELESEGIPVNAVSPGYTKTNLTGFGGFETVEQGAAEAVRVALLGPDSPTGKFTRQDGETIPW